MAMACSCRSRRVGAWGRCRRAASRGSMRRARWTSGSTASAFPHDAIRDPADGTIMVTETANNQIRWIDGTGASATTLRALGTRDPRFGAQPNGADRFDHEDSSYLLLSHRRTGSDQLSTGGMLTLWDITTAGNPRFVWRFPEDGVLDTPHAPIFRVVRRPVVAALRAHPRGRARAMARWVWRSPMTHGTFPSTSRTWSQAVT